MMTTRPDSDPMQTENHGTAVVEGYAGSDLNNLNSDAVSGFTNSDGNQQSKYFSERYRLMTFNKWSNTFNTSPQVLAKYGFIHVGPKDKVLCVFCLSTLENMNSNVVVQKFCHDKRSPNNDNRCPFVDANIPLSNDQSRKQDMSMSIYINLGDKLSPIFPAMVEEDIRYLTFDFMPLGIKPGRTALAKAGFFYASLPGKPDRVKCFMCGVAVHKWKPTDDAMEEHKKFRPECDFVIFNHLAVQAVHFECKKYTVRQLIDAYKHIQIHGPDHEVTGEEVIIFLTEKDCNGNS